MSSPNLFIGSDGITAKSLVQSGKHAQADLFWHENCSFFVKVLLQLSLQQSQALPEAQLPGYHSPHAPLPQHSSLLLPECGSPITALPAAGSIETSPGFYFPSLACNKCSINFFQISQGWFTKKKGKCLCFLLNQL